MTNKQIKLEMEQLQASVWWGLITTKIDDQVAQIVKMFINWPLEWSDEKKYSKINILQMQCRLLELIKSIPSDISKWALTYSKVDLSDKL